MKLFLFGLKQKKDGYLPTLQFKHFLKVAGMCALLLCVFSGTPSFSKDNGKNSAPEIPPEKTAAGELFNLNPINTLEQALTDAYLKNPDLDAARAQLRQTDEGVSQAISEWRPDITGSASQTYNNAKSLNQTISGHTKTGGITANQSLFSGGGTHFRTQSAETGVLAGRESLVDSEQTILLNAVQAFIQVYTETEILTFLKASENVLQSTVDQTTARYEVGEVTRTEVAAAEAQLAEAAAKRVNAEGLLETFKANFLKIIGRVPGKLEFPKVTLPLPKTRQQAIDIALQKNPGLLVTKLQEKASEYDVNSQIADLLPQINAQATAGPTITDGSYNRGTAGVQQNMSMQLSVTVPIYRRGTTQSKVRQAEQKVSQLRAQRQSAQRGVVEAVIKAWSTWKSSQKSMEQFLLQVKANDLALAGVREEYSLGLKSLLDVLQIENNWREAQISWAQTRQNEILQRFQIMALIGLLTAKALKLKVPYYDPKAYYNEHRGDLFGLQ